MLEATVQPTEPQPLPKFTAVFVCSTKHKPYFLFSLLSKSPIFIPLEFAARLTELCFLSYTVTDRQSMKEGAWVLERERG